MEHKVGQRFEIPIEEFIEFTDSLAIFDRPYIFSTEEKAQIDNVKQEFVSTNTEFSGKINSDI